MAPIVLVNLKPLVVIALTGCFPMDIPFDVRQKERVTVTNPVAALCLVAVVEGVS